MSTIVLRVEENVHFDVDDILEEIDTADLIRELKNRKQSVPIEAVIEDITALPNFRLREYLQDQFGLSHVVSDEILLTTIKSYLK